jgi:hypothetical protein
MTPRPVPIRLSSPSAMLCFCVVSSESVCLSLSKLTLSLGDMLRLLLRSTCFRTNASSSNFRPGLSSLMLKDSCREVGWNSSLLLFFTWLTFGGEGDGLEPLTYLKWCMSEGILCFQESTLSIFDIDSARYPDF